MYNLSAAPHTGFYRYPFVSKPEMIGAPARFSKQKRLSSVEVVDFFCPGRAMGKSSHSSGIGKDTDYLGLRDELNLLRIHICTDVVYIETRIGNVAAVRQVGRP